MNSMGGMVDNMSSRLRSGGGTNPTDSGSFSNKGSPNFGGDKIPKGYKAGALQQYTPEQLKLLQHTMGFVGPDSYLSRLAGGDEELFNEMEAPALRQFNQLQGNIASRFSGGGGGQGAMSSRRSSAFQNATTSAASNFAQELQSKRQDLMRQAIRDLTGISSELLEKRPFERTLTEKPKKWWEEPLSAFTNSAAKSAGESLFGGGGGGGGGMQQAAMLAAGA